MNTSNSTNKTQAMHIAIIGSGSGAFACAIQAAQAGATVTMIEAQAIVGGCCVNVGCVPSKILIRAAHVAQQQRHHPFAGVSQQPPVVQRAMLAAQQIERVEMLRQAKYQDVLAQNPAITLVRGHAHFQDAQHLVVVNEQGDCHSVQADKIVIATGSKASIPEIQGLADTPYWTSDEAVFSERLPKHLLVIGSSVIALELAQAYLRLGSAVTLLARSQLLSRLDPELGDGLSQALTAECMTILTDSQISQVDYAEQQFTLQTNHGALIADQLLVCTGRHANTAHLDLDAAGVHTLPNGQIPVNAHLQTNVPTIYAVGDCTTLDQYVYVAAAAGSRAGQHATGTEAALNLDVLPAVIFTDPQVATVGFSVAQAEQRGLSVVSRSLSLDNVPRALVNFDTQGFIKLVADAHTERLLGAQILAAEGGEVIQAAALAIANHMTIPELANQLFPYLTMVEGLKLCAQTFHQDVKQLSCCAG